MQFFIIHGSYGSSNDNWIPWIKEKLQREMHVVIAPDFPTPLGQELEIWRHTFSKYLPRVDSKTIFIGHSVGCAFIFSVLEKLNIKISACVLVAGFVGPLRDPIDKMNSTFTEKKFNWEKIRANCDKFILFNSNNDPYVPLSKADELVQILGPTAELIVINNAGHFNEKSGYTEFPELLEKIRQLSAHPK